MNEAEAQLRARGLDEGEERIVEIIDSYFQMYRSTPVTAATVVKLIESTPGLKWLSAAELEYRKIAAANPAAAQELVAWLNTQGKPGQLVNSGDAAYENLTLLLGTLQGYEISTVRIQDAENRIANRAGRKLHYVATPRRTEPVSPHAKADDGKPFMTDGLTLQRDGSLGKSPADYAREARARSERDAAEAASQRRSGASAQSAAVREAKNKAEQLRGNTHSENEQIGRIFVTVPGTSEINWPDTLAARLNLQRSLNKAQEVRRFIR